MKWSLERNIIDMFGIACNFKFLFIDYIQEESFIRFKFSFHEHCGQIQKINEDVIGSEVASRIFFSHGFLVVVY